jgi:hypothetical protein
VDGYETAAHMLRIVARAAARYPTEAAAMRAAAQALEAL